jgi:hypothetical protein
MACQPDRIRRCADHLSSRGIAAWCDALSALGHVIRRLEECPGGGSTKRSVSPTDAGRRLLDRYGRPSRARFDTFAEGSIDGYLPWPAMRGRGETAPSRPPHRTALRDRLRWKAPGPRPDEQAARESLPASGCHPGSGRDGRRFQRPSSSAHAARRWLGRLPSNRMVCGQAEACHISRGRTRPEMCSRGSCAN